MTAQPVTFRTCAAMLLLGGNVLLVRRGTIEDMHHLTYIAVEADDEASALSAVEEFLADYYESVYDYYVIGGRWSGSLGGNDTVCAGTNRRCFIEAVERGANWNDDAYHDARQHLAGPDLRRPVTSMFGSDGDGDERVTERVHASYQASANAFAAILRGDSRLGERDYMLLYRISRFTELLQGAFNTDCSLYDVVTKSTNPAAIFERVGATPERQWLVAVDMHS